MLDKQLFLFVIYGVPVVLGRPLCAGLAVFQASPSPSLVGVYTCCNTLPAASSSTPLIRVPPKSTPIIAFRSTCIVCTVNIDPLKLTSPHPH